MKTIKRFFFFTAEEPFFSAFFITALVACILTFFGIAFLAVTGNIPNWKMIGLGMLVLTFFYFVLGIVNTIVAKTKITKIDFNLGKNQRAFIHLPNGEKEVYKGPVWGKFKVSIENIKK